MDATHPPRLGDRGKGHEMQVAKTILEQLGGSRFLAMTGAKNLLGSADALTFQLPANFARDRINVVRITLTAADLYDVEFIRRRGLAVAWVAKDCGLYADQLRASFEAATGLRVSL